MIRKAKSGDDDQVRELIEASGLFQEGETEEVFGVYAEYCKGSLGEGHEWAVFEGTDGLDGISYFAPETLSNGVWNLYFIAVRPEVKGGGIGKEMVAYVERQAAEKAARLLIVETSGLDSFVSTRAFYASCGFEEAGRIRDYYGPGEAKVIFLKDIKA